MKERMNLAGRVEAGLPINVGDWADESQRNGSELRQRTLSILGWWSLGQNQDGRSLRMKQNKIISENTDCVFRNACVQWDRLDHGEEEAERGNVEQAIAKQEVVKQVNVKQETVEQAIVKQRIAKRK